MNKRLSKSIITKILGRNFDGIETSKACTSDEIDVCLYLAYLQDALGVVKGVSYKDAKKLGISKSNFYNCLYALAEKGIIELKKVDTLWGKEWGCFTATILNNEYISKEDCIKNPYLNIDRKMLFSEEFRNLTRGEKTLVLRILCMEFNYHDRVVLSYSTLKRWAGVTLRTVKKYIDSLKNVFEIFASNKDRMLEIKKEDKSEAVRQFETLEIDDKLGHPIKRLASIIKNNVSKEEEDDFHKIANRLDFFSAIKMKRLAEKSIGETGLIKGSYMQNLLKRWQGELKKA